MAGVLLLGGVLGLPFIETGKWGGLMLTLVLSYVGIVAALPIGTCWRWAGARPCR